MSKILKLNPFYSEKIWGYEEWNLSTHKNGLCTIKDSETTLLDSIGNTLPIMIKVIQANDTLSVQVHPDDEYSRKYENDNGKTECWYILDAKEIGIDKLKDCVSEYFTHLLFTPILNNVYMKALSKATGVDYTTRRYMWKVEY